jgi:hypothetical protein
MKEKKYIQKKNNFSINNFNYNNNNINIIKNNNNNNNNNHKKTSSLIKNYTKQKRWERLYQLDKFQREKLKKNKEIQDNYRNEHELDECTFSPQIYNKNFSNNNSININNNNEKYDSENFLFRQKVWNRKRNEKMESMKKENENKFYNECFFSPKISTYDIPYYEGTTADIVLDPESYEAYINKKNKIRSKKKEEKFIEDNKPGSGKIWKNKNIIDFNNDEKKKNERNLKKMKLFISNKNGEIEGIDYYNAKKWLHNELFSIEI